MTKNNLDRYLTKEKLKQQIESDRGWYFITFIRDLPPNRSYDFTLFNEPFVLLKNEKNMVLSKKLLAFSYRSAFARGTKTNKTRHYRSIVPEWDWGSFASRMHRF